CDVTSVTPPSTSTARTTTSVTAGSRVNVSVSWPVVTSTERTGGSDLQAQARPATDTSKEPVRNRARMIRPFAASPGGCRAGKPPRARARAVWIRELPTPPYAGGPVGVARRLQNAGCERVALLHASGPLDPFGRFSYVGADPDRTSHRLDPLAE